MTNVCKVAYFLPLSKALHPTGWLLSAETAGRCQILQIPLFISHNLVLLKLKIIKCYHLTTCAIIHTACMKQRTWPFHVCEMKDSTSADHFMRHDECSTHSE